MSSPNHQQSCPQNLATQPDQIPPNTSGSDTTKTATPNPGSGHVFGPIHRRSKASRRAATTLINTDITNFRAVVHQFTGCPKSQPLEPLESQEHPVMEHAQQLFLQMRRNTNTRDEGGIKADNADVDMTADADIDTVNADIDTVKELYEMKKRSKEIEEEDITTLPTRVEKEMCAAQEEEGNPINTLSTSYEGEKSKYNEEELIRYSSPDNTSSTSSALVESEGQEEEITNPTQEDTYEVYLSFSDETHKSFTDFLYTYLVDAGIRVFENKIHLHTVLLNYSEIKESKISIPIFSRNYASSTWCLQELAHMVQCHTTDGLKILPIFYDVDPNLVEHQLGSYQEAFHQHETIYEEKTIQGWKMALIEVAKMPGFVLHKRHEGELIKNIVENILSKLDSDFMDLPEDLIGMDHHIEEMEGLLDVNSNDVFIVGIHGRGGIGKTTIAKVIYNKLHERFECSCFLEKVRELLTLNNGLSNLQSQLLSKIKGGEVPHINNVDEGINTIKVSLFRKKVLIILDDVDEKFRFDKLVGKCELFGSGSRIIVTTRYKEVIDQLKVIREVRIYEPRLMNPDHSIHLFSKCAFMSEFPPEDFNILSKEVVSIAGGIPSILVTTGTLLFGEDDKELWEEILRKLKKLHEKDNIVKSTVNIL